ncbi:MAG: DUF1638 domain-containing protein [Verrucomicrobia bacterium]|nr:DUF1638 domain-containing protein [Verrucomicrobiota bacterium]
MFFKVIACEIALREICQVAARTPHLVDLEFLTQGHHDTPALGRAEIQKRLETVPAGRYDAILLGYGLCSNILVGLRPPHTRLVIPRAHDCITFFLGSKERYQQCFTDRPGTYYFTSGWLECRRRRGDPATTGDGGFMPAQTAAGQQQAFEEWVRKYGEDQARYLQDVMAKWSQHYTHGTLIDFEFAQPLRLEDQVRQICADRAWQFERLAGDLDLLERWLAGEWDPKDFLVVAPGQAVQATFDEAVIGAAPPMAADAEPSPPSA